MCRGDRPRSPVLFHFVRQRATGGGRPYNAHPPKSPGSKEEDANQSRGNNWVSNAFALRKISPTIDLAQYISYVPDTYMVESKSLKLYLFSFRNHGDFHEDCINKIMKDLIQLLDPKYMEIWGKFTPRGGISIDPYCNYGKKGTEWLEVAKTRLHTHDMYPEKVDNR